MKGDGLGPVVGERIAPLLEVASAHLEPVVHAVVADQFVARMREDLCQALDVEILFDREQADDRGFTLQAEGVVGHDVSRADPAVDAR